MNGAHDMGGMQGLGRVEVERNEPVFHKEWEKVVFVMQWTTGFRGLFNTDEFRHSMERMNPVHYLSSRYYEHWLCGMETLLVEKGILSKQELDQRISKFKQGLGTISQREDPEMTRQVLQVVRNGDSTRRDISGEPKFEVGGAVKAKNINPTGHTRLPRYLRGKAGTIAQVHGAFVFPDTNAHGLGENPQHVYSVRFDGREVWGETSESGEVLYADLWESYLDYP
jgi:nitrile hydratase subunit beta